MKRPPGSISLNCMDKTLLSFDCANEPMIIHAIIDIEGADVTDHIRLNQSIQSAQNAFPIMRSILKDKYLWPYREIHEDVGAGVLTVQDLTKVQDAKYEDYLFEWMNRPMDLGKIFPVRVLLIKKTELESALIFTFHHSSTDALRACTFMRKVIETYNSSVFNDSDLSEDIRISRKGDELIEFLQSKRPRVQHYYMSLLYSTFYRLVLAAIPFPARIFHDKSGQSRIINLCNRTIGPKELKELESKATSVGVELNDILLASAYRLVEKWNGMHGKVSRKIRVMAPVNISIRGFSQVLCNQLSWISIPTWPKDRSNQVKLLKKLRSEVIYQSMTRRFHDIPYFFYVITRVPLFISVMICRIFVITRTYTDSVFFTNIGVVWPQVGSEESAVTSLGRR